MSKGWKSCLSRQSLEFVERATAEAMSKGPKVLKSQIEAPLYILKEPCFKDRINDTPEVIMFLNQIKGFKFISCILNAADRKLMPPHVFG